jgi:hypothetical protein
LIFGEQHLRRVLAEYSAHYNLQRPHRALQLRVASREVVEFGFAGLGVALMTETAIV